MILEQGDFGKHQPRFTNMAHYVFLAGMATILSLLKSASASATCDTLASTSNIIIEGYLSIDYDSDQHEYWYILIFKKVIPIPNVVQVSVLQHSASRLHFGTYHNRAGIDNRQHPLDKQ